MIKGSQKEDMILRIIERFRVVYAIHVAILAGLHSQTVARNILSKYEKKGLIKSGIEGKKKAYTITKRGLSKIGITGKTYVLKGFSTYHRLCVADVACWLYEVYGVSYLDLALDQDFRLIGAEHAPDLAFGATCVEVELTLKTQKRLYNNMDINSETYATQIWVVPDHLHSLRRKVSAYPDTGNDNKSNIIIVESIESIQHKINNLDLKNNQLRNDQSIPIFLPKYRTKNLDLLDMEVAHE